MHLKLEKLSYQCSDSIGQLLSCVVVLSVHMCSTPSISLPLSLSLSLSLSLFFFLFSFVETVGLTLYVLDSAL